MGKAVLRIFWKTTTLVECLLSITLGSLITETIKIKKQLGWASTIGICIIMHNCLEYNKKYVNSESGVDKKCFVNDAEKAREIGLWYTALWRIGYIEKSFNWDHARNIETIIAFKED